MGARMPFGKSSEVRFEKVAIFDRSVRTIA
jgi:hypothetical protein